uniref:Integrase core domain-containing protein n=1 Tax=Sander lucioperca TaxID=283035 RepID=A0A8D0AUZ4_SANLU
TLRRQVLLRLLSKFEMGLARQPIDLDYFEFTCRQELYLCNALSRHFNVPAEILQALDEFFKAVKERLELADVHITPNTVPGAMGRPMLDVDRDSIEELLELDLPVPCISKMLGVSRRTLFRRLKEFELSARRYSVIDDDDLDNVVQQIKDEMPTAGYRMVKGRLRSIGINVQWRRVAASLHRVDSVGILSRLHVDTNHKLIWLVIINRPLNAATNNLASTAFSAFKKATERHGIPSRVRGDQGVENVDIARFMFSVRGTDRGSFMSGKSVHNQRFVMFSQAFEEDLFCVHMVFLPKLEMDLEQFVEGWNHHPIRTENNRTPEQLWQLGLMNTDIEQPENIEVCSPNTTLLNSWAIVVPEIECPLSEEQREVTPARELYLLCREYLFGTG